MRKRLPLIILCGLGAAGLAAIPDSGRGETPPDHAAVDRYLLQLEAAEAGGPAKRPAGNEKLAATAQKLERARPMLDTALNGIR